MNISRIDIVSVPVSDPAVSKVFYSETLGFDVIRDDPMGPDRRWIQLMPKGAETSITLVSWFEKMPPGVLQGMVLDTDDIDVTHGELKRRGLDISEIDNAPWGRYATFSDPDGNGWIVQQAVSGS